MPIFVTYKQRIIKNVLATPQTISLTFRRSSIIDLNKWSYLVGHQENYYIRMQIDLFFNYNVSNRLLINFIRWLHFDQICRLNKLYLQVYTSHDDWFIEINIQVMIWLVIIYISPTVILNVVQGKFWYKCS